MKYRHIGNSSPRFDAVEKVTGEAKFTADILDPSCLTARILRSPHAHARIKSLHKENALSVPGVKAVVTGENCAMRIGMSIADQPPLAVEKVRFEGEPVAAVIAENDDAALKAISLIEVEYEELPCVTDVYEAVKKGAPVLHESSENNIFHHYRLRKGDTSKGMRKAHLIVENAFSMPHVSHAQLETHGCMACWHRDGSLEVTASTQGPFYLRDVLANLFGLRQCDIRVHAPYLGGGFGGKSDVTIEPLTAYIAKSVPGVPVKLILTREEAFTSSLLGRGMRGRIKTGVSKEGKILATEIEMHFNAGAYADCCIPIVIGGGQNSPGPYLIPNIKVDSYGVYTNTSFVGAFRGYGHPEGAWMTERQIDIVAEKLKMDPVKLRLKNCWKPGGINHLGVKIEPHNGKLDACIKKAVQVLGPLKKVASKSGDRIRAKGLACFMKSPVMAPNAASSAIVKFASDGTVNLSVGTVDMGQGAITALSQICAEKLELPLGNIRMARQTDTQFSPYEWMTVASRGTWSVGNAVIAACFDAIEQIRENAALAFKTSSSKIIYEKGKVYVKGKAGKKLDMKDVIFGFIHTDGHAAGGPVTGYGYFMPHVERADPKTGQGRSVAEWTGGCQGIEIEIDRKTGEIHVLKMLTVIDAGTVVNPQMARGQVVGSMVQALGHAVSEGIIYSPSGNMRNRHFTDYKVPSPEDVWETEFITEFIETPEEGGPYGARSMGEHAIVSIAPALANAVKNGTGMDFFDLPMTPDRIATGIKDKGKR